MGGQGRRRSQLLDDLKETKWYWKLKEEALDCTLWRTRFGRGYEPILRLRNGLIFYESRFCSGRFTVIHLLSLSSLRVEDWVPRTQKESRRHTCFDDGVSHLNLLIFGILPSPDI
jgi:hypothetical protein